jgi:hypothetical protein
MTPSMLGLATAADHAEQVALASATCPAAYILDLLEPFDAWTRRLSGSVTLSLVPRAVGELLAVAQAPVIWGGRRRARRPPAARPSRQRASSRRCCSRRRKQTSLLRTWHAS